MMLFLQEIATSGKKCFFLSQLYNSTSPIAFASFTERRWACFGLNFLIFLWNDVRHSKILWDASSGFVATPHAFFAGFLFQQHFSNALKVATVAFFLDAIVFHDYYLSLTIFQLKVNYCYKSQLYHCRFREDSSILSTIRLIMKLLILSLIVLFLGSFCKC